MDAYILKRKEAKVKPTAMEEGIKQGLQKALLAQKIKFKEEQKKAQALMREVEKQEMKNQGQEVHKNIILPKYVMN